jgi:hypothetical protein
MLKTIFWKISIFWRKNFINNLLVGRILVLTFLTVIMAGYIIYGIKTGKRNAALRRANLSYTGQVNELNRVEASLKNLIEFVNSQKVKLKDAEDTLAKIKEEVGSIEPVLSARREEINAIFALQESRTKKILVRERAWGILIGVVATLMASSIIWIVKDLLRKARSGESNRLNKQGGRAEHQ